MRCNCSTAGRAASRRPQFERWVIAPTARIVAAASSARHPDTPIIGFPKGAGGKLARLCARNRGRCDRARRDGRSGLGGDASLPAGLPVQGNLDPLALIAGGEALRDRGRRASLTRFADRPHIFNLGHGIQQDTPIAHVEQLVALVKGWGWMLIANISGFLGAAYLWVKAAHVTFVIFWIAGLFMLPRFYVYHQATTPGSAEDRAWIEREDRARTIILTPAMLLVWVLGLMLAVHLGAFGQRWFSAKLLLVVALTGYQGWIGALWQQAGRAAIGRSRTSTLRMMNEVPGIVTALIVVLVIVRPF